MEEALYGRGPQWRTTSMEDNLNGRQPQFCTELGPAQPQLVIVFIIIVGFSLSHTHVPMLSLGSTERISFPSHNMALYINHSYRDLLDSIHLYSGHYVLVNVFFMIFVVLN